MNHQRNLTCLLFAALITSFALSCQHGNGGQTVTQADSLLTHQNDSADSAYRENTTFALYYHVNDLRNRFETDSLEMIVPDALKTCIDLGKERYYYLIWSLLAENYVWTNQVDKALAEAQRMQEDALKRDNQFGLFNSYKVLGGDRQRQGSCALHLYRWP